MTAGALTGPTRRELRREQTTAEIKELALEQVAAGGPDAVSLNGIARSMRMSPAALYRYFTNRDALLADLVVENYTSLADDLVAIDAGRDPDAGQAERFTAIAHGYRRWALANPHGYRLIFQSTSGSGSDLAPERTIPASERSMTVLLTALTGRSGVSPPRAGPGPAAATGPAAWTQHETTLGLIAWTRLHGVVSLELGHHLASSGADPARVYAAEIGSILREATARG